MSHQTTRQPLRSVLLLGALCAAGVTTSVQAADWSDTSIGYRTGSKFAEPFGSTHIGKDIINLTHVSGYKYGTNFLNVDMLMSDSKDPAFKDPTTGALTGSAQEVYIVYRNTVDLEKATGKSFAYGPVKGLGVTGGFDYNTKDDAGYNSKKRMLVLGPTAFVDVPGFLNVSLLWLQESNAPHNATSSTPRYSYRGHPMLTAAWGIPVSKDYPISFEGFANFIASKGKNEFGGPTAPETNIDAQLMYDVSSHYGKKGTFKVGVEYQYWKNKFGNPTTSANPGATAKTPMIRAEYHF